MDKYYSADPNYNVYYDKKGKSGALKSHWAINARGKVPALNGVNPSPHREFDDSKTGVFIHTSNVSGKAGNYYDRQGNLHGISEGCLLIVPSGHGVNGWNEFNEQLSGIKQFLLELRRK